MGEEATRVHFWTRAADALDPWDPDAEPGRHANAFGHSFLELHHRMRSRRLPVTIGAEPPSDAAAVVVSFAELSQYLPKPPPLLVARLARAVLGVRPAPSVVVIRDDVPLHVHAPAFTTLEVMPTAASVRLARQAALPMLPQRGLIPRDPSRGERLEVVAMKAYSYNVPSWVDDRFRTELEHFGWSLRVDTERSGRWHDFADVDVVLCMHPADLDDDRRKPPTKLIAAWSAGVIPICGDYRGYREIGVDGQTMLVAGAEPGSVLAALRRLRDRPELPARIRASLPGAAARFNPDSVVEANWDAMRRAPRASRVTLAAALVRALAVETAGRIGYRIRLRRGRRDD